jgi:hypothetical protein
VSERPAWSVRRAEEIRGTFGMFSSYKVRMPASPTTSCIFERKRLGCGRILPRLTPWCRYDSKKDIPKRAYIVNPRNDPGYDIYTRFFDVGIDIKTSRFPSTTGGCNGLPQSNPTTMVDASMCNNNITAAAAIRTASAANAFRPAIANVSANTVL